MPKEIIFPHNTYEVCSKSNFNLKIKKKQSKLGWNFFLNFFWHSRWRCTHNFAELNPLTEGGGEVLFGVASQPPPSFSWRSPVSVRGLPAPSLPLGIRRNLWVPVPVNKAGAQSSGCPWRWSACGCQFRWIKHVPNHLDALGGDPFLPHSCSVDQNIGPGGKPLLLGHYRPLLLENLHEPVQGLHDKVGFDYDLPGNLVHV